MRHYLLPLIFIILSQNAAAMNCTELVHQFSQKVAQYRSASRLINSPDLRIKEILNDDTREAKSLGGQALAHLQINTNLLDIELRSRVWEILAQDIHRQFPDWDSIGPFRLLDNSLAFKGTKGVLLILRSDNNQAYLFAHTSTELIEWNIKKDYEYLIPLKTWLKNKIR